MSASVSFVYNGSNQCVATVTGAIVGHDYVFYCDDPNPGSDTDTAVTSTVVLTLSGIGGATPADLPFAAAVYDDTSGEYVGITAFAVGETTQYSFPATWSYDGVDTVEVTFVAENGVDYHLTVGDRNEFESTTYTGTGADHTMSTSVTGPLTGSFYAQVYAEPPYYPTYATRMFSYGVEGSGRLGNPTGAAVGRVLIAFDDGPRAPDPTWTRVDDTDNFVTDIEIVAGKQTEFDQSDTNRATVRFNDTEGLLDPNNSSSPWFGNIIGKQIMLQLYNPVEDAWFTRFRGTIKKPTYDIHPATRAGVSIVSNVALECVGIFDYLARLQQTPGLHGDIPPAGSESTVFWEDGEVDERLISMLGGATGADLDSSRYVVFSGNVLVIETKYDPGDPFLIGLRDAADAETPIALANIYEDRFGRFVFHGRGSRIDPDGVAADAGDDAWDFQRYKVGDGAAITGDADYAQIRPPFRYSVPLEKLVNAALFTPRKETNATAFNRADVPGLVVSDSTSISAYGVVSQAYSDNINGGHKTNGDTASEDLKRSAQFLVDNYKNPRIRLEAVTVKAMAPTDARAEPTWNILSRADISDVVTTTVGYAGGEGIDEDSFVEGFTQTITPLNPEYDYVELSLNLSPVPTDASAYNDDPS